MEPQLTTVFDILYSTIGTLELVMIVGGVVLTLGIVETGIQVYT